MKYINEEVKFWKHSYKIHLSEFDLQGVLVNADNEQDALDYAINYHEEQGHMGLFMDEKEMQEEEYLDDYFTGGNHGLTLSSMNVNIERLD